MTTQRAPVTAAMIVKDDPKMVEALKSVAPYVAQIVVVCNGNEDDFAWNDDAIRTLAKGGPEVVVHHERMSGEIDFAALRNRTLELTTQPYYLWLDSDDTVEGAEHLPSEVARLERSRNAIRAAGGNVEVTLKYPYWYSMDAHGRPTVTLDTRRIVTNPKAWIWEGPCHEALVTREGVVTVEEASTALVWKHHRLEGLSGDEVAKTIRRHGERNLRILTRYMQEVEKPSSRMVFYFGNELADAFDRAETDVDRQRCAEAAIAAYQQYFKDPHVPQDERYEAVLRCSKLYLRTAQHEEALHYASMAMCVNETLPDAYLQMAYIFSARAGGTRDWERTVFACKHALRAEGRSPYIWTSYNRFDVLALLVIAHMNLGQNSDAVLAGEEAMQLRPEESDPKTSNLAFNVWLAKTKLLGNEDRALRQRVQQILAFGHEVLTRELQTLGLLPPSNPPMLQQPVDPTFFAAQASANIANLVAGLQQSADARKPYEPPSIRTLWRPLNIVFLCGQSWETWNPDVVAEGMGGSETAVVEMARRLAKRGHHVAVDSKSVGEEGTYEGVVYSPDAEADFVVNGGKWDVAICWRDAGLVGHVGQVAKTVLWVHDTVAIREQCVPHFDKIFALSQWHADYMASRNYPKDRIVVTRNGVNPDLFSMQAVKRNPFQVIYSSSPDRGLLSLLQMWPRIEKAEPRAELVVAYGFDGWDKNNGAAYPCDAATRDKTKALLFDLERTHSVHSVGRVGKMDLARLMLQSGVLAYPCWFHETYCISLDEALCAGLDVVTSPIAALAERGKGLARFVKGDWLSAEYQDDFVNAMFHTLRDGSNPAYEPFRRKRMEEAQRRYDWEGVVDQWEREFGLEPKTSERLQVGGAFASGRLGKTFKITAAIKGFELTDYQAGLLRHVRVEMVDGSLKVVSGPEGPTDEPKGAVGVNGAAEPAPKRRINRRRIHFVLEKHAVGEPPIDPHHPFDSKMSCGSRVGFMGLVHAMAKRGDWDVFAWSRFAESGIGQRVDDVVHMDVDAFPDNVVRQGDVVFAFYDTRSLANEKLSPGVLKIASHHSYVPPFDAVTGDIHTAPSDHAIAALSKASPGKFWRKLPNGVGDRPVIGKPVPGRVLYHASADRGLHHLLEMWPDVLKAVPEATLHVVGDVSGYLSAMRLAGRWDARCQAIDLTFGMFCASKRDCAISFLGKLSFDDLMKELGEASVFAYPCDPPGSCETFSISVMECLKAGVQVVLKPADSLDEIYRDAAQWEGLDVVEMDDFKRSLIWRLRHPLVLDVSLVEWASSFTFEAEATRLVEIIGEYEEHRRATEQPTYTMVDELAPGLVAKSEPTSKYLAFQTIWHPQTVIEHDDCKMSGPIGDFWIPGLPKRTAQVCRQLSRQIFEGEYDHPLLPSSGTDFGYPPTILDIGCGWGAFAVWAKKKWPDAKLFGFDPHARALEYARRNAPFMGIMNAAVTTQKTASILLEDDWGHTRFEGGKTPVPVVHPRDLGLCDILKIDTEGCDLEILSAYNHLRGVRAVLYEWHQHDHRAQMAAICRQYGLRQVKDAPVLAANGDYGMAIWVRA